MAIRSVTVAGKAYWKLSAHSLGDSHPQELKEKPGSFLKSNGFSRRHKYYTQVQGQLALCDKDFCDFVVWTPKGITIEGITRDLPFWEKLNAKLTAFSYHTIPMQLL